MDHEQIDRWCERGILGLVLAILVFSPLAMGANGPWEFCVVQGLTLGVLVLWGLRWWFGRQKQLFWPPVCWAVAAFLIYAGVRYYQADVEYVARKELIRILLYGCLFFAIVQNLHRPEHNLVITLTLLGLGMLIAMYACAQIAMKSDRVWNLYSGYPGRGSGTFIYPNSLAAYLEMLVPLGFAAVLSGRHSHLAKVGIAYAAIVILAGVGATLSRGGWLVAGAALVLLCLVLLTQRDYRIQAAVLVVVLIGAGWYAAPKALELQDRVRNVTTAGNSGDIRVGIWQAAGHMWQDHFWWGAGPAQFDQRFNQYRPVVIQKRPGWVHNDYLNTLVDYGVAGAALIAVTFLLLGWGIWQSWKSVRSAPDTLGARKRSNRFAFLAGASVGLAAILLHSLVDFNLHIPAVALLAVTLMALLTAQLRQATDRFRFEMHPAGRFVATIFLAAGLGYLGWQEVRAAREYAFLPPPAGNTVDSISLRAAALERAWAVDPMNFDTTFAIGECYRNMSWWGGTHYVQLAEKAMQWYERGARLNPYDPNNPLREGMCLDWISDAEGRKPVDAWPYYQHALDLDPNGFDTSANVSWHFAENGDYAAARTWYHRSYDLEWTQNDTASNGLALVERRLRESADRAAR